MSRSIDAQPTADQKLGCDYMGYEFGASYPDSVCIDGYLWDADSGDADGLTNGGDIPCPQCNHREWRSSHTDEAIDDAYIQASDGKWPFCKPRFRRDALWLWWCQLRGVFAFAWDAARGKA